MTKTTKPKQPAASKRPSSSKSAPRITAADAHDSNAVLILDGLPEALLRALREPLRTEDMPNDQYKSMMMAQKELLWEFERDNLLLLRIARQTRPSSAKPKHQKQLVFQTTVALCTILLRKA